jgi:hypothetical protein
MSKFRLSRRSFLRGAGSIAIALPWLELMHDERLAKAGAAPARRFLAVFTPGGTVHQDQNGVDKWSPTGTEHDFTLSPILKPLAPVQERVIVFDGVSMKSANGDQQQAGMAAWLTGRAQSMGSGSYPLGPSIDQVLAKTISAGKAISSLELAVRWGTGKSFGRATAFDLVNFRDDASFTPIVPRIDPAAIWAELFGSLNPAAGSARNWDKSILDYVDRRYTGLASRIGAADKQRIEEHLSRIRELEQGLSTVAVSGCVSPQQVNTSGYDPQLGLHSTGIATDGPTDAAIPTVGKYMIDLLVMAFACDHTAVGTLLWSDAQAVHTFPWLNLNQTYAFYQGDGGYHPAECEQICTWYAEQHSYLLERMAAVDMGFHSLLDESVVFFGSNLSNPATHRTDDMPFLLAGGGGGLKTGRWLDYRGPSKLEFRSHNDLLVSLFNLFGDPRTTFGNPTFCTGPLANLP